MVWLVVGWCCRLHLVHDAGYKGEWEGRDVVGVRDWGWDGTLCYPDVPTVPTDDTGLAEAGAPAWSLTGGVTGRLG